MDVILRAYFAGSLMAMVFGVISPNVSKMNVIIPVIAAILNAKLWSPMEVNNSIRKAVAIAEAPILVMLFPMRMAVIKFRGFSKIFSSFFAPFIFCSFRLRNFIRLTAVKAVSAPEKKADSSIKIKNIINFKIRADSNMFPLAFTY